MKKLIKKFKKNKKAFTLVEMLVVLVVVALLMVIIIPNVGKRRDEINKQGRENLTEIVQTQVDAYKAVHGDKANVSYENLISEGYLTEKQAKKAQEYDIRVSSTPASTTTN